MENSKFETKKKIYGGVCFCCLCFGFVVIVEGVAAFFLINSWL